jgi:hypothetical protein
MLGLTTILTSIRTLIGSWDIEIIDDKDLLERTTHEHILVAE